MLALLSGVYFSYVLLFSHKKRMENPIKQRGWEKLGGVFDRLTCPIPTIQGVKNGGKVRR